jgi:UDP-N-acetylmuramate--alanine ligase
VVGTSGGVTLVDDYGHHPAEIRATLEAARRAFPGDEHRIVVAFQPHRYTRTKDLFDDFTRAFNQADVLLVTDIYAAGEARSRA